jgi:predicted ATPase
MEGRLLERDAELGRLAALVDDAAAGHGRAAAVLGPAGIGKTSLLDRARDRAAARGLALCAARGGELERDFPYGVVRQLFELPLRSLGERERAQALDGAAALAAPAIGLAPGDDAGASSTFAIVHGLYWLTANLAQATPLLVLVDDVHWADAGSLRFLAYLARRLEGLPVLLLVAARPPVDPERADLVDAVTGEVEVVALHPAPLSEAAVAELASGALGTAPEPELARACHEATGGNPFLCRSLVAALADADAQPDGDRARLLADLGARASADAIVRGLGRLPGAARALARAVAILGTDVELRHAATLAELDARAAAGGIDEHTTTELLLRLRERQVRRELAGADLERTKELQEQLEKIRATAANLA